MAVTTVGDVISRVRTQVKGLRQDPLLTDRVIYTFIKKHSGWLLKREDSGNRLMNFMSIIQSLDFVELVEVDKIEACCTGLSSDCKIRRTKNKLPEFMQGYNGPLIREVTSIDNSEHLQPTNPTTYVTFSKSKNFKYNTTKYFWYINNYLYFPNLDWDAVRIEGIFEGNISQYNCDKDAKCTQMSDQPLSIPEYLLGELESNVFKDLVAMMQLPPDTVNDKQNIAR